MVKHAIRSLRRWPAFTLLSVTLLALGIGMTTAFGSLAVGVLLTPPPYADPSRLVLVTPARIDGQPFRGPCTARQCGEWSKASAFAGAAAYFWVFDYLVLGEGSASLEGMAVSSDYFKVIGVSPIIGRAFTSSRDVGAVSPGRHPRPRSLEVAFQQRSADRRTHDHAEPPSRAHRHRRDAARPALPARAAQRRRPELRRERDGRFLGAAGAGSLPARHSDLQPDRAAPRRRHARSRSRGNHRDRRRIRRGHADAVARAA